MARSIERLRMGDENEANIIRNTMRFRIINMQSPMSINTVKYKVTHSPGSGWWNFSYISIKSLSKLCPIIGYMVTLLDWQLVNVVWTLSTFCANCRSLKTRVNPSASRRTLTTSINVIDIYYEKQSIQSVCLLIISNWGKELLLLYIITVDNSYYKTTEDPIILPDSCNLISQYMLCTNNWGWGWGWVSGSYGI